MSDEEELKEEIRVVKDILALEENMCELGYSSLIDSEKDIVVPMEYHHLLDQQVKTLKRHLHRLEQDLEDLESMKDGSSFNRDVELYRGKERD